MPPAPPLEPLAEALADPSQPIAKRMTALFLLRTHHAAHAVDPLGAALRDKARNSTLLRHELAFVLGQLQDERALPVLSATLEDVEDDVMVRHESAEALGAIGSGAALPVLERFRDDPAREVSETCVLAVDRVKWSASGGEEGKRPFQSVDPTPAAAETSATAELTAQLCDGKRPLFERYAAMFALRNRAAGSDEAEKEESVLGLCAAFAAEKESALLRHEVAYVLGQLEHPSAIPALTSLVRDGDESSMVRHEAAEALGAIGSPEAESTLRDHLGDADQAVRESCEVALGISDYWSNARWLESDDTAEQTTKGGDALQKTTTEGVAAAASESLLSTE